MTASGTIKVSQDSGGTKTLTVVKSPPPPKVFVNPEAWVWDLVKNNAGAAVTVDYTDGVGDPAPPPTINSVEVG